MLWYILTPLAVIALAVICRWKDLRFNERSH